MAQTIDYQVIGARLSDPSVDNGVKVVIVNELRDAVEILQSIEYPRFLSLLLPTFISLLGSVSVSLQGSSNEHKLRNTILELIHRFPQNDTLKPFVPTLIGSLMAVLKSDNEDNGVLALKITIDLHKSFKPIMEEYVQPFLDCVQDMYKNVPEAVRVTLDVRHDPTKEMPRSMASFKALTECPVIIATIFSLHRKFVPDNVPQFIPLAVVTILAQPKAQAEAHRTAEAKGSQFYGCAPALAHTVLYVEFKSLQVKTLSFIAYMAKTFLNLLKPYQDDIASGTLMLLKDLPPDASVVRKELLVAIRHLLFFDLRSAFVKYVDLLLTDQVLIGTGVTAREVLRPLGHSVIVDLIHHIRNELSIPQMHRIIRIYSRNLHHPSFAPQMQTMSCKLLLSLIDNIVAQVNKDDARKLLILTLDAFARRLSSLQESYPSLVKYYNDKKSKVGDEDLVKLPELFGFIEIGYVQPIRTVTRPFDASADLIRDMKLQLKTVLLGIKTTLFAMRNAGVMVSPSAETVTGSGGMIGGSNIQEEIEIFVRIFRDGLECYKYFTLDSDEEPQALQVSSLQTGMPGIGKDDKEYLEAFASIFTFVEPWMFQEVLSTHLEFLYEHCVQNLALLAVPQFFLVNITVSPNFIGLLLSFLDDRLDQLSHVDSTRSSAMLRIFKLLFMAVTLFPDSNETVLRPYLAKLITTSLKLSSGTKNSLNYFLLLRTLFRSIGGGRFEMLYQEVLPLLQVLLETLNSLLVTTSDPMMRELFVELCLTVPVRLSVLLPHLSYLMRPLVIALCAGPELASQSLKTLELCVDNLNQEFLEPIFAPVMDELMSALWKHLKPNPYNPAHATMTMRILGKFGGRNRRVLKDCSNLDYYTEKDLESMSLKVTVKGMAEPQVLGLSGSLDLAIQVLSSDASLSAKQHAFGLSRGFVPLLFDTSAMDSTDSLEEKLKGAIYEWSLVSNGNGDATPLDESKFPFPFFISSDIDIPRKKMLDQHFKDVLICHFLACEVPELEEEAWATLEGFFGYVSLVALFEASAVIKSGCKVFLGHELMSYYASSQLNGFVDALVAVFSRDSESLIGRAQRALEHVHHHCRSLLGDHDPNMLEEVGLFHILVSRFASSCYLAEWPNKIAGALGISIMTKSLGFSAKWIVVHQLELIKALLYVLKHMAISVCYFDDTIAMEAFTLILKVCNDSEFLSENPEIAAKQGSLVTVLFQDLSNSNAKVRTAAQFGFTTLADLAGSTVTSLISPGKDKLLSPIFSKPLRALPLPLQMGYIDAITYCLSLDPPLLTFNDELLRLLHEALAIADAEDQALVSKSSQFKAAASLVNLRVLCIKLLSAAYGSNDLGTPRHLTTRNRILSVFFKSLYFRSTEIVDAANEALQQILTLQHKLPKELLQSTLRPILVNLSDHKKLSVSGIEGLSRLMKLLTNYFKVEIGKKLLDHVKSLAEPKLLEEIAGKSLMVVEEVKIIASVLNVFYLLPAAANIFLPDIIAQILEMESKLCRTNSSPFRQPILKYLDKYHTDAVEYFMERLPSTPHTFFLMGMLQLDQQSIFRVEWLKEAETWIGKCLLFDIEGMTQEQSGLLIHGVHLIHSIATSDKAWLLEHSEFISEPLLKLWKSRNLEIFQTIGFNHFTGLVLEILLMIAEPNLANLDMLLVIAEGLIDPNLSDNGFLKKFIYRAICQDLSKEDRRKILIRFVDMFNSKDLAMSLKAAFLRFIITPMLMMYQGDLDDIVDDPVIEIIHANIWTSSYLEQSSADGESESLKVEVLQLGTFLLQKVPARVNESRKDVIKFAWNLLKAEDIIVKQSANVLLSQFVTQYDTPSKIVMQFYVALLKTHQLEGRNLVRQALDTVLPIFPTRIGTTPNEKVPIWVQWIRKILVEDGHLVQQVIALFQLLLRNADQFYESRDLFLMQILGSLTKLGLSGHATTESRSLTIDLCKLVYTWESRAFDENPNMEVVPAKADENAMDWTPDANAPLDSKEMAVNYLFRMALYLNDPQPTNVLVPRVFELIKSFIVKWPEIPVKISHLEKVATMDADSNINLAVNAAELLKVCCETKPMKWSLDQIGLISKCFDSWFKLNNDSINTAFYVIIQRICLARDEVLGEQKLKERNSEEVAFFRNLDGVITNGLRSGTNVETHIAFLDAQYAHRLKNQAFLTPLRSFLPDLARYLGLLAKDLHTQFIDMNASPKVLQQVKAVEQLLQLLNSQVLYLGEQRKAFLNAIGALLDHPRIPAIHAQILKLLENWIFDSSEAFPTLKEKAMVAVKFLVVERHGNEALFYSFMSMVARLYGTPALTRSDLTIKLEHAFLEGTRVNNVEIRDKFLTIFNSSLRDNIQSRFKYIIGVQSWQSLSGYFWIRQALDLLLDTFDGSVPLTSEVLMNQSRFIIFGRDAPLSHSSMETDDFQNAFAKIMTSFASLRQGQTCQVLIESLRHLSFENQEFSHSLWNQVFPIGWASLNPRDRHDTIKELIGLLSREYHLDQADVRPNVIQALLDGVSKCSPPIQLPPHLLKFLGKTFNAWHICIELLQQSIYDVKSGFITSAKEDEKVRDIVQDALAELYSSLSEEDYFYGLWRRRSMFQETGAAVTAEQHGMWSQAQTLYEAAQDKARNGQLPFTEYEYCLWEDHWRECAKKLQQWDLLTDLAKNTSDSELLLECCWRLSDWSSEKESLSSTLASMADPPTARKKMFEAYTVLQKLADGVDVTQDFQRLTDEGSQLMLKQWYSLPELVGNSHIKSLHAFQQFVELQEAWQIQNILISTNVSNIEPRFNELRQNLMTWRERLPNPWDDMDIWSDLIAWRQHVFTSVNQMYLPLLPGIQNGAAPGTQTSFAFRGYHETAWIINRFAHVARKQQLPEVCISSLSKIYTLPNIEIPEAFYKLSEQAKCHLRSLNEYSVGLDVINNTNLQYFNGSQKAEFYTLKAQFLAKLNLQEEAQQAFSAAIQIDLGLAKGWAAWGQYNDKLFTINPTELSYGADAINCYLHAAGTYNNARSRKYLARILWLLSLDDEVGTLSKAHESFKGDIPVWYWISFIPHLINSLIGRASFFARIILVKLAKSYPQALHFALRTAKEEFFALRKQLAVRPPTLEPPPVEEASPESKQASDNADEKELKEDVEMTEAQPSQDEPMAEGDEKTEEESNKPPQSESGTSQATPPVPRHPLELVEDVTAILKTAFPLLSLTMETMVENLIQKLKPITDEDIYRLTSALLTDGIMMYMTAVVKDPKDGGKLSSATEANLLRFCESMEPNHTKFKKLFEEAFITSNPNLSQLVSRFREWKNNLEVILDSRPQVQHLEQCSHFLAEFEYQKFDEVEVPGQYLSFKNNNKDFVKIERFDPIVKNVRGQSTCHRELVIYGHDGSAHPFMLQHPASKYCRRDERIVQFFSVLNNVLDRKRESRRRNISFCTPAIISFSPQVRLMKNDTSYVSLHQIWESYAKSNGIPKDQPAIFYMDRMREMCEAHDLSKRPRVDFLNLKYEIMEEIATKIVPETILTDYAERKLKSWMQVWTLRKRFTTSWAANIFMTHIMSIGNRLPSKIHISFETGTVWFSDLFAGISAVSGLFANTEAVPFRLTPNIQHFMTPIGIEGVFTGSVIAIGRSLSPPQFEMEDYLHIFIRDELLTWQHASRKPLPNPAQFREHVLQNAEVIVKRALAMSCQVERSQPMDSLEPINQTLLDLISQSCNPLKLGQMDIGFLSPL